jgi:hypothetical protein
MAQIAAISKALAHASGGSPTRSAEQNRRRTCGQILKSTAVIGGSWVDNIGLVFARSKAVLVKGACSSLQ